VGFLEKFFKKKAKPASSEGQVAGLDAAFAAFQNRKKYDFTSFDVIDQISDEDLIQAIFDYVSEVVIEKDWKNQYRKVKSLPIGFQHIFGLWLLEAEVNNGGFNQFFYNSSGEFVDEAMNGCIAIGATRTAKIVSRAVETIMAEKEMQLEVRKKGTIEAFSESYKETKLGECDNEFFKYEDDLQNLQIQYIRNIKKDFRLTKFST
jgi:hypothetical protein